MPASGLESRSVIHSVVLTEHCGSAGLSVSATCPDYRGEVPPPTRGAEMSVFSELLRSCFHCNYYSVYSHLLVISCLHVWGALKMTDIKLQDTYCFIRSICTIDP